MVRLPMEGFYADFLGCLQLHELITTLRKQVNRYLTLIVVATLMMYGCATKAPKVEGDIKKNEEISVKTEKPVGRDTTAAGGLLVGTFAVVGVLSVGAVGFVGVGAGVFYYSLPCLLD